MSGIVLILGASGRFGRHAAEAFWNAGWQIRPFDRTTGNLMEAARGVDVIVNAWNPPYPDWQRLVPGMTRQVIAAARVSDATVMIPGNVYVHGRDAPAVLDETTPQLADTPLGRVRVEMEEAYRAAGIRTVILRAGDFIDTEPSGNWFDKVITRRACAGVLAAPGDPGAAHAWAYLPDLAAAAVALAEYRDRLGRFEIVPFPGYTLSLRDIAGLCEGIARRPMRVKRFDWTLLTLLSPAWKTARHLGEMRYLWDKPHRIDGAKFSALLPGFRHTDRATALAAALEHKIKPDQPVTRSSRDLALQ